MFLTVLLPKCWCNSRRAMPVRSAGHLCRVGALLAWQRGDNETKVSESQRELLRTRYPRVPEVLLNVVPKDAPNVPVCSRLLSLSHMCQLRLTASIYAQKAPCPQVWAYLHSVIAQMKLKDVPYFPLHFQFSVVPYTRKIKATNCQNQNLMCEKKQ